MFDKSVEDVAVLDFNPVRVRHDESGLSAAFCHHTATGPTLNAKAFSPIGVHVTLCAYSAAKRRASFSSA